MMRTVNRKQGSNSLTVSCNRSAALNSAANHKEIPDILLKENKVSGLVKTSLVLVTSLVRFYVEMWTGLTDGVTSVHFPSSALQSTQS
jgi:hypothetical protein